MEAYESFRGVMGLIGFGLMALGGLLWLISGALYLAQKLRRAVGISHDQARSANYTPAAMPTYDKAPTAPTDN